MIFNVNTSGEKLVLPILNSSYPSNVDVSFDYGESTSATFTTVIATDGKPAIYTYQWFVDGVEIVGATSPSYTMTNINSAGTKYVWCVVTNKAGSVESNRAILTVTENYRLPVLNASYPANVTAKYDSGSSTSATFKVEIATAGNPDSQTYQWYYDGEPVSGATGTTYTRSGLNAVGEHEVYCLVTHVTGGTVKSNVATLTVRKKFVWEWNDHSNMSFHYGNGKSQGTSNVGAYGDTWNDGGTRYGQVLWFTTDEYGGTGFTFNWNPRSSTGDNLKVYCRITEIRSDGCYNTSSDNLLVSASGGGLTCSNSKFVFKPKTKYYIYIDRGADASAGYYYYSQGSGPITYGTSSIKIY